MLFSRAFRLNKFQSELDFVDVDLRGDTPLFIDPYAISKRNDSWSIDCHNQIITFFERLVEAIKENRTSDAFLLLQHLDEPNDIHLGLSRGKPQGKGVSGKQAKDLYDSLKASSAVKTGFLNSLSDCELLIPGISRDKISDITANIIRRFLLEYTAKQCFLHNIPTTAVPSGFTWDSATGLWEEDYVQLPVYRGERIVLVPKAIARIDFSYDHQEYYNHFVLNYLQAEHLRANTALVHTLKKGTKKVYKKDLKGKHPCNKEFLYNFSKNHPEVLAQYRESRDVKIKSTDDASMDASSLAAIASELTTKLDSIKPGNDAATQYHNLSIGLLEYIFYPELIYPVKEQEIHSGRKRIDISFSNAAREGIFHRLHNIHGFPCSYLMFECKNYTNDPANPELDQLSGRFSPNRGRVGFLLCRNFSDKKLFIKRCNDTAKDDRGVIIPLDDEDVKTLIAARSGNQYSVIDKFLDDRLREILCS